MVLDELYIWSMLRDDNILPLLGFTLENESIPALISEWMENGTVSTYLKEKPFADILSIVGIYLLDTPCRSFMILFTGDRNRIWPPLLAQEGCCPFGP